MEVDQSDYIRVSLVRTTEGGFTPTAERVGRTVVVATPVLVGTPDVPAGRSFGPMYKASAAARLKGTSFEIELLDTEYQSLDQDRITWDWNVRPLKPGSHIVNACIVIQWEPIGGEGETTERTIWRAPLSVVVDKPWIRRGQLSVSSLASGLLGSVLSIPLLCQKLRERKTKRRKKPTHDSIRRQLDEALENLRLIQERKSQFVMETDIPLQLVKEERHLLECIEELEQRLSELESSDVGISDD